MRAVLVLVAAVMAVLFIQCNCFEDVEPLFNQDVPSITPKEAYHYLNTDANNTFLVDVRTDAEWHWVGTPILPSNTASGKPHYIQQSLLIWPDMHLNEQFGANVLNALKQFSTFDPATSRVILMCCCGNRSKKATDILQSAPFNLKNPRSMYYGFNGDLDQNNHRGTLNGWKVDMLPWQQS